MPPGSSYERQTVNPFAAMSAACSLTVCPCCCGRVDLDSLPADLRRLAGSVRTASAGALCRLRDVDGSNPWAASATASAGPSRTYVSSFSRCGPAATDAVASVPSIATSPRTGKRMNRISNLPDALQCRAPDAMQRAAAKSSGRAAAPLRLAR